MAEDILDILIEDAIRQEFCRNCGIELGKHVLKAQDDVNVWCPDGSGREYTEPLDNSGDDES